MLRRKPPTLAEMGVSVPEPHSVRASGNHADIDVLVSVAVHVADLDGESQVPGRGHRLPVASVKAGFPWEPAK